MCSQRAAARAGLRLDLLGAATSIGGLVLLLYAFTVAADAGAHSPATLIALSAAGGLSGSFWLIEACTRDPVMPSRLLTAPSVSVAAVTSCTLTAATSGRARQSVPAGRAGLHRHATDVAYVAFRLAVIGRSWAGARLIQRTGPRTTIAAGLLSVAVAMGIATAISPDCGLTVLVVTLAISGAGLGHRRATAMGISASPSTNAASPPGS